MHNEQVASKEFEGLRHPRPLPIKQHKFYELCESLMK